MLWLQPLLLLNAAVVCQAQNQAPALPGTGASTSSRDRVYSSDQTSNTITVIDPSTNTVLGTIDIGDPRLTDDLNPQYVRAASSHGLGFSRDGKYIVSLSILTNTVNVIRTIDNTIVSQTHSNRAPHEAFFAGDNRTVWVGTRGVASIDLIDGIAGGVIARIPTADGPSKVLFSPNGTVAYVNHIRAAVVSVIDVASREVMYNITGLADTFSSDMMLSADGLSLWAAHKMTGQVSVIDLAARKVISVLDTGPETNHPQFAYPNGETHVFVTVAALNETKVYLQPSPHEPPSYLTAIQATGIEPHPLWANPANTRLYIANEHSDTMDIVDLETLEVIDTLQIGQETQAVVYVSNAVPEGDGCQNLGTQGLIKEPRPANLLVKVTGPNTPANGSALITVRPVSGVDEFQVIGRDIHVNSSYTVDARCLQCPPDIRIPLVTFTATETPSGGGGAPQVLSFFKWFGVYDLNSIEVSEDDGSQRHHY